MNEFTKVCHTLEFDKILKLLAECARTEGAKELALEVAPLTDEALIERSLDRVDAAMEMSRQKGEPPFGGVKDVTESLERAERSAVLTTRELLDIANLLRTTRSVAEYRREQGNAKDCPSVLDEDFSMLLPNNSLEKRIFDTIISEDMIADSASNTLYEIRRKIRSANNRIKEHLQKYVNGSLSGKFLQENIVTMRNGRYVIPVKAEYKNEVKGLVHDTSGSGATIFIEPMAVVEANNELRELSAAEQHEIERILSELSADCASSAESIKLDYNIITALAFVFAKAEFARKLDAERPQINNKKRIELISARHPLLDRKKVVPVSLTLGKDFDTLIITGPNTGGKTVSLKTIGLFALMVQAGLFIPADKGTSLPIFKNICADIGDEQSIEQSLSTFSSHMVNIVGMLNGIDDESLVLFDELGAGTDPVEGAALATALIERVRKCGALCVATTHYAELKSYAVETDGVQNAGCEFDIQTLRPTYKLIIGAPGKSNAFAISEKLGLSGEIVKRAEMLVDSGSRNFEKVIEKLEASRLELEAQREALEREKAEYESFKAESEKKISDAVASAEAEAETVRAKAVRLIEGAKLASEQTFQELEKIKKKKDSENFSSELEKARKDIRGNLRNTETDVNIVIDRKPEGYVLPRALKSGDEVLLCDIGKYGILDGNPKPDGRVSVKVGNMLVRSKLDNLMLRDENNVVANARDKNKKSTRRTVAPSISKIVSRDFKPEIDLRGENGEDAWFMVDRYIDEANLVNIQTIRLIHGKGTGALKNALWNFLKKDKRVKSFRLGMYGEGDCGVTVVELK